MDESKRLQLIINELNMLVPEFAHSIGISRDSVYNYLDGTTKISARAKNKLFTTYPNLNKEWFEKGIGEMYTWKNKPENTGTLQEDPTKYHPEKCESCADRDKIIEELRNIIVEQRIIIEQLKMFKNIS